MAKRKTSKKAAGKKVAKRVVKKKAAKKVAKKVRKEVEPIEVLSRPISDEERAKAMKILNEFEPWNPMKVEQDLMDLKDLLG